MEQAILSGNDCLKLEQILDTLNEFIDNKIPAGSRIEMEMGSVTVQNLKDLIGQAKRLLENSKKCNI